MGGTKKAGILADCPGEVRVAPIIATVNVSGKMQAHILN
jgi:ADP-dependent phosphofructokinase/glucokinase